MRPWPAVLAAAAVAVAAVAAAVPAATSGFTGSVQQAAVAQLAPHFRCASAAAADASSAVFQWSLTDTGTTAADSSGRGFAGTYAGTRTTVDDPAGVCPRDATRGWVLNGTSSYVSSAKMSQPFSTTALTLEARVRAAAGTSSGGDILSSCGAVSVECGARDDRLYLGSTGRLVFGTYSSGEYFQILESAASIADGQWHHVAGTLSSAGMRLHVDGVDVTATSTAYRGSTASHAPGADPTTFTTTRPVQAYWHVGGADGSNWPLWARTYFTGRIGWAAVYSTALPAAAIRAHWAAGR